MIGVFDWRSIMINNVKDFFDDYRLVIAKFRVNAAKKMKWYLFLYKSYVTTVLAFLAVIGIAVLCNAFSWIITCGIIKLITVCFGLQFSWKYATGIWLLLTLLRSFLKPSTK